MASQEEARSQEKSAVDLGCYRYFGIRSHLHHFYDYGQGAGDSESQSPLLRPKKSKRCTSNLWKIITVFGVIFLISGAALVLVGHFTPRHQVLNSVLENQRFTTVDSQAERFNSMLDSLGTVGITLFCIAGALLAIAALLPSRSSDFCQDEEESQESTNDTLYTRLPSQEPMTPMEKTIPATGILTSVQPASFSGESYKPIE